MQIGSGTEVPVVHTVELLIGPPAGSRRRWSRLDRRRMTQVWSPPGVRGPALDGAALVVCAVLWPARRAGWAASPMNGISTWWRMIWWLCRPGDELAIDLNLVPATVDARRC